MSLYEKPHGVQTRWFSFESANSERGRAGLENRGCKGHAFDMVGAGESKILLDVEGSGVISRIWMTIDDRGAEMLRGLRLDIFWDNASEPAVSAPFGDFFGVGLGRRTAFECALFSDPEGRSFNCFIPMPFRTAARVVIVNESEQALKHLFYDIDLTLGVEHSSQSLYFHTHWRRESPNQLGQEFTILPKVRGVGRFLGCNVGIIADERYAGAWWGEGEVKCRFGDDEAATLCGTGTEDYIGTGWGQGVYSHRTQGCLIADGDRRQWAFYRYHLDDPIYFDDACQVTIQTIGGAGIADVLAMRRQGVPLIPISLDTGEAGGFVPLMERDQPVDLSAPWVPKAWCNFWRRDDWSAAAYFYLDSPAGLLPPIAPAALRTAGLGDPATPE